MIGAGSASRRRTRPPGALLLIAVVSILVYLPSLDGPLVMDDAALLSDAAQVELSELFGRGLFGGVRDYGGYYRPLTALTFAVESRLGWESPARRHLTNVVLHAGTAVLAFLLLTALLPGAGPGLPFAAALLFALHPVAVDAVDPVTGRGDLLAASLMLASWWAFAAAGREERPRPARVVAPLLFGLALLSKESAAVLPALLALGAWRPAGSAPGGARAREILRAVAPALVVLAAYLLLRSAVLGGLLEPELPDPLDNPLAGRPAAERLAGAPAAWLEGLRLLLWPRPASPDYSAGALPVPGTPVRVTLAGWGLLGTALAGWIVAARRGGATLLGLSILLVGWAPTANLLFTAPVLLAGRALYLPALGVTVLLAQAGTALGRRGPGLRRAAAGGGLLLGLAWGGLTLSRHGTYADEGAVWAAAVRSVPGNAKAWYNLGNARMRSGQTAEAATAYRAAVSRYPGLAVAWSNLGVARVRLGDGGAAEAAFRSALELDPTLVQAHAGLGSLLLRRGEPEAARRHLRQALVRDPGGPDAPALRALLHRIDAGR